MFVAEKLVFLELHKTGGTHIGRWLAKLVGGEQVGKHNRLPMALRDRFIVGSVRNPWDWYVSLWAYGCSGQGSVYRQTTRRLDLHYVRSQLCREMGVHRVTLGQGAVQCWHDLRKPVAAWRSVYQNSEDAGAFREWLKLMLDRRHRFDMGEGYGFSPVSWAFGLMTYRYVKLFTAMDTALYRDAALGTLGGLRELWKNKALVGFVVRNEMLEPDLLTALRLAGYDISIEDEADLLSGRLNRTNTSKRRATAYYYDDDTAALVGQREAFIVETHGYRPPTSDD